MGGNFPRNLIQPGAMPLLVKVSEFMAEQKVPAYLVGGFVRDALLGRDTADIDIAVGVNALGIARELADLLGGKFVLLDEVNGVGRVVLKDWVIDVASFIGKIKSDLKRRDFTIDAMAVDLNQINGNIQVLDLIDPLGGQTDLDRGLLRVVAKTAFEVDPIRLLRAVRLAAELGFSIDRKTEVEIKRSARLLAGVPGERVREEFLRLLEGSCGGRFLVYLDELGLLTEMIPEMAEEKGVEQPKEHHWDVFEHSINAVSAVDFILRKGVWEHQTGEVLEVVPWSPFMAQYFEQRVSGGSTRRSLLKLAALLHDIAKPQSKSFEESGRMRFLGHPEEGATSTEIILERLRFSTREIKLVAGIVRCHHRPTQMSQDEMPSKRAIYRYFRDVGEAAIDTLYFSLADHLATRGPGLLIPQWQWHARVIEHVLREHFQQESAVQSPKLVDGNDLIDIFGMKPCPRFGELLERVRELQASGELTTREEALDYIRNILLTEGK
ncbi:MAG: CCA tRNA nucleotidyltransferase [Dehalococcoidales bacterium]|nr:CCA tRNA nucleotidyltransferase [Dehalococcoidales bacterium]